MHIGLVVGVGLLAIADFGHAQLAAPESVAKPSFKAGSQWIYRINTRYSGRDNSVDVQWTLLFQNKKGDWVFSRGKPVPGATGEVIHQISGFTDESWSGRDSTGMKEPSRDMLSFPLTVGKTWQSRYEQDGAQVDCSHRVVSWDRVNVSAGAFVSLKIEYECVRDSVVQVRVTQWYAPEVQNFVREVMRFSTRGDDQNLFELLSFRIGK